MESPGRLGDAGSEVSMSKQCRAYEVEVGQASSDVMYLGTTMIVKVVISYRY